MDINGTLTITGTLNAGSSTISVAGGWVKTGTFNAGTSTVVLDGSQTVSGSTTFNNLTFAAGVTLTITVGTTQTINGAWVSSGTSGSPIALQSSSGGSVFTFVMPSDQSATYTNPTDSDCSFSGATGIAINGTLSNATNWKRGNFAVEIA